MKKILALALSIMLVFYLAACGGEKGEAPEKEPVQTTTDNAQEQNKTENSKEGNTEDKQGEVKAPVIESADELEGMINEFNDTEDPERKEELRQQLEAILSQAEEMAQ